VTPHNHEKSSLINRLQAVADTATNDSAILTDEHRAMLSTITNQLATPRNVVIAGPIGSQHGMLAEFIIGRDLFTSINDIDSCPPIRIRYGNEAKTVAITASNRTEFPGCSIEAATTVENVALIDLELPSVSLSHFSIVLFTSYQGREQKTHDLFQLVKSSEVIVWCSKATTEWNAEEDRLWKNIPEQQKDHSILVLTAADHVSGDQANHAFEEKCEDTSEYFSAMVAVSVDAARAAAPDGQIRDVETFAASGGQNIVSEIIRQTEGYEKDLVSRATNLLTELETLQETAAQRKQMPDMPVESDEASDVEEPTLDAEDEGDLEEEISPVDAPTREEVRSMILTNVSACRDAVIAGDQDGYVPVFQAMVNLLHELRGSLKAGLKLETEHHQMAVQLDEAEDLVGLLSYECDEKAAFEAADIVRQVSIDFWSRVAAEGAHEDDAFSEDETMENDQDEILEHQIAV